jgi:DNA-binding response OmpR family regulator
MATQFNLDLIPKRAKKFFEANRNVMIIEDDKIMGAMISDILDDIGFRVTTATNGKVALDKLLQKNIDFILLDLLLPEMDGFEIYSMLQKHPETKDIPVMIISAWADDRNRERGAQMGIDHFLPKPFTEDELVYTILTLLVDHTRKSKTETSAQKFVN